MAKRKTSKASEAPVAPDFEIRREGEDVVFALRITRKQTVPLSEGIRPEIDLLDVKHAGYAKAFAYGLKRYLNDGARKRKAKVDARGNAMKDEKGIPLSVPMTPAEKKVEAQRNFDHKWGQLTGTAPMGERADSVPPLVGFFRALLIGWIGRNITKADGARITGKDIPAEIARGLGVGEMVAAAIAFGVPAEVATAIQDAAKIQADALAAVRMITPDVPDVKAAARKRTTRKKAKAPKRK